MDRVAQSPERREIAALKGLRFVAALLVVISHFPQIIPIDRLHDTLVRQGAAGVTIFFVLSGFVLTYNYADAFRTSQAPTIAFIRARIARILPINIVSLILATLILSWWSNGGSAATWVINLLMLQALVPTKAMLLSWNPPAWSVSCELVFYALFPFLCGMLVRVRDGRRLLQLAVAFFVIEVLLFCAMAVAVDEVFHRSGKTAQDISWAIERLKSFPGLRIWEFLIGCVVGLVFLHARAGHHGWWRSLDRRYTRDAMLAAAAVGVFVLLVVPAVINLPPRGLVTQLLTVGLYVAYTPLAVLIVTAVAWGSTAIHPVLEQRWVTRMGEASYSFYMLQWPALLIATAIAGGAPGWFLPVTPGWWLSVATILGLALVSLASVRWIEAPARRVLRGTPSTGPAISMG